MATAEGMVIQRIRLQDAYLCQDCDCVCNSSTRCECGSAALLCLSTVLNRCEEADEDCELDAPCELDVCHHGVGFDEECEDCELDDEMENAIAALGVPA